MFVQKQCSGSRHGIQDTLRRGEEEEEEEEQEQLDRARGYVHKIRQRLRSFG